MPTRVLELFAPDALGADRIIESLRMLQRAATLAASEATVMSALAAADDGDAHMAGDSQALPNSLESLVRRQRSLQKQRRMSGSDVRIPVALTRDELRAFGGPCHVLIINFQTLHIALLHTPRAEQFQIARDIVAAAEALGEEIVSTSTPTPDALLHSAAALVRQRSSRDDDCADGASTRVRAAIASVDSVYSSRPAAAAAAAAVAATTTSTLSRRESYLVGDFVFKYSNAQLSDFALIADTLINSDDAAAATPTASALAAADVTAPSAASASSSSSSAAGGVILTFEVPE